MSYQQYMNMGFGAPGAAHPYMMGFPGMQMPVQQQQQQQQQPPPPQYMTNNRPAAPTAPIRQQATPHKGGKRKMNTDPNRPKRPTSAYFYFVQIEREEAAKRGEKITRVAEWTKQVSAKWRELTITQKEQFQVMAATDKARYTQQMAIYTGKDANRPKRPQSAYFLWLADFRARMKDKFVENKDILRAAGEEWRKMTTDMKAPYEQRAEEERRKYEVRMKEYNGAGGGGPKKPRIEVSAATTSAENRPVAAAAAAAAAPPSAPSPLVQYQQLSQQQQQQLQQHHQQLQQQQLALLIAQQQQQQQQQLQQQQQQQQQTMQAHGDQNYDDDDDDDDDDDEEGDFDDENYE